VAYWASLLPKDQFSPGHFDQVDQHVFLAQAGLLHQQFRDSLEK